MSRRKQENPQPRKRLINAEAELLQDTLTCGSCQKTFVLSEIVKFIQHKVHSCNKENNFIILEDGPQPDFDSDREGPMGPIVTTNRGPSISAPICNRKGLHHQHHHLHRNRKLPSPTSLRFGGEQGAPEPGAPQDKNSFLTKKEGDEAGDKAKVPKEEPVVKQEVRDPLLRASPKVMVNAYTNTIITEPSTYTCSTCKQTFTSAWVLVQHAQHMHGMKIYLVTSYHGSRGASSNPAPVPPPPPSLLNSSGAGGNNNGGGALGIPLPPVLPPCTVAMNGPTHHAHHHGVLPLENHPALQLLRMPLGERQFGPPNLFARPSSQDFRVDMLATSSASASGTDGGQFHRLNHHPPPLGLGGFDPHNPFVDRGGPLGLDSRPRPPPMSLGFEPQMDFYSQRLRQLAGATSPTATASPRKLTPPFTAHPPMSSSSQPSTPTSTPQPVHSTPPSSSHPHGGGGNPQGSSASSSASSSSKGGGGGGTTDGGGAHDGGSPKLLKSWSCEFCGKAFRFQSNLIVHRRSHTGEKPYKCPVCRHSCSQASKLKRHMKTHQPNSNNGKCTPESPRSTPDSTSETAGKRQRRGSLDDDEDASDGGQTADNEEEEEDLDDEDEEEEEDLDDDDDLNDSNEVMMAEDLSTRGPNSAATPVPSADGKPKEDASAVLNNTNNNDSSNTISASNGENGNSRDRVSEGKPETRHSLLGEVMDKIGLSNIQQYNEAYQKALEESSLKNSLKDEHAGEGEHGGRTENGPEKLGKEDAGSTNSHGNGKSSIHPHAMEFGHGFFGAFDYHHHHHHHHHNAFEASKRLKLDLADHLRGGGDRDSLYAGLWLPSVPHRDLFGMNDAATTDLSRHSKSSSSESALKSVTPTNMCSRSLSPRPGTSGGVAPMPGLLVNSKGGGGSKEQRRNDTCEYCGKVFKNCSNLTVHRRSHTGEKPYKCELCSYACAQSSKLTRHMKTHGRLGKDVYRCRFCDMPFSVPSTLEKHMRKCVVNQNASAYMDRDSDSKELT